VGEETTVVEASVGRTVAAPAVIETSGGTWCSDQTDERCSPFVIKHIVPKFDRTTFFAHTDDDSLSAACATCPTTKHCCHRVNTIVVTREEMDAIVRSTSRSDLFQPSENAELNTIRKERGKPCPFLSPHETCSIYEIRPKDCRAWPITHQSPPRLGHYSVDSVCPAITKRALPGDFVEHAVLTLWSIEEIRRTSFAALVHLDESVLPLLPVELSLRGEKK